MTTAAAQQEKIRSHMFRSVDVMKSLLKDFIDDLSCIEIEEKTDEEVYKDFNEVCRKYNFTVRYIPEHEGVVKFYDPKRGYGYITPSAPIEGYENWDVYFGLNEVKAARLAYVIPGSKVRFAYVIDQQKGRPRATRVRIVSLPNPGQFAHNGSVR